MRDFVIFLMKAAVVLGLLALAVAGVRGAGVWAFATLALLLAVPIAAKGSIATAIRRGHALSVFARDGWVSRWFSGAFLRIIIHAAIGLTTATIALIRLMDAGRTDWLAITAGLPVYWAAKRWNPVARQLAEPFRRIHAGSWARWCAVATVVAVHLVLLLTQAEPLAPLPHGTDNAAGARSALVAELLHGNLLLNQLQAFALGLVAEMGDITRPLAMLVAAIGQISLAFVVMSLIAAVDTPPADFRRAIGPASAERDPPPLRLAAVIWSAALSTVFAGFIWLPEVARLDARLAAMPQPQRPASQALRLADRLIEAEQVDGTLHRLGTLARLEAARAALALSSITTPETARHALIAQINGGADAMIGNVDGFLDGYYSLSAEYARILAMLAGDLEAELADKLSASLNRNSPFAGYDAEVARLTALTDGARAAYASYRAQVSTILDESRIAVDALPAGTIVTVTERGILPAAEPPGHAMDLLMGGIRQRMTVAGTAGAGLVGAVIVKKIIGQGTLKLAAKAVVKAVGTKAASGGAGAGAGGAAGGAIGSVVPGVGTVAGAAIGAVLGGILVGVSIDAILLEIEEAMNRESFRGEIVAAINERRQAMIAAVNAPAGPAP